jgi:integrase
MTDELLTTVDVGQIITTPDLTTLIASLFDNLDVSENTRYDYEKRTPMFLSFIERTGLTRNSYLYYKRYLAGRIDYSVATKAKYLVVAKVILKELNRLGYLPCDITSTIRGFKQSKQHKRTGVIDEEMKRIMELVKSLPEDTRETSRLQAILSLLTFQGFRQIEVSRLNVSDLDLSAGTALVLGKGRDDKELVFLHPETTKVLTHYLQIHNIRSGSLFVSTSNNSRNGRLPARSIGALVKPILRELGISKTIHGFRHYYTTTLLKTYKGSLLEVAQLTRHKSLEMLRIYNDSINQRTDYPRYVSAFAGIGFSEQK